MAIHIEADLAAFPGHPPAAVIRMCAPRTFLSAIYTGASHASFFVSRITVQPHQHGDNASFERHYILISSTSTQKVLFLSTQFLSCCFLKKRLKDYNSDTVCAITQNCRHLIDEAKCRPNCFLISQVFLTLHYPEDRMQKATRKKAFKGGRIGRIMQCVSPLS